jgi:hypothetical protein
MSGYALKAGWLWEDLQVASARVKAFAAAHSQAQQPASCTESGNSGVQLKEGETEQAPSQLASEHTS